MIYRDLKYLDKDFRVIVDKLIAKLKPHISSGEIYPILPFETYRDRERQKEVRKGGTSLVDISKHQAGIAIDFVVKKDGEWTSDIKDEKVLKTYNLYGKIAKELGLIWGGDWKSLNDVYHVELKRSVSENDVEEYEKKIKAGLFSNGIVSSEAGVIASVLFLGVVVFLLYIYS